MILTPPPPCITATSLTTTPGGPSPAISIFSTQTIPPSRSMSFRS